MMILTQPAPSSSSRLCIVHATTTNNLTHRIYPISPQSTHTTTNLKSINRRQCLLTTIATTPFLFTTPPSYADNDSIDLITYTNPNQGYSLQRPSLYEKVDKQGADVLFENPQKRSATLGVTVLPVMISSLDQFGTLEQAGERLLAVERGKESTLGVEMLTQKERIVSPGSIKMYDFVYELNSTRGRKRICSTVTIANKKLYIANANIPCGKVESCQSDALEIQRLLETATQSLMILD